MKSQDMRFDMAMINNLPGEKFKYYKCDTFDFTNSVTQIVGFCIGNKMYALTNIQEPVDYFGTAEDISVYRFDETEENSIRSAFSDTEMIKTPIDGVISQITLVNERQEVIAEDESYSVWLTRGIIFEVDGREIAFEKDVVPFSEEIIIQRGYHLIDRFSDKKEFLEGWDDNVKVSCDREVIKITMKAHHSEKSKV